MEAMEALPVKRRRLSPSPSPSPSEQGFFDKLPDSMVEEILLRLPLSSVFRSRCVSQRCLSLTASPDFIQRFCRRNSPFNEDPPFGLLLQDSYFSTTKEFFVCSRMPEIKFSGFSLTFLPGFRLYGNDPITVVGSCDDLLLCCIGQRFQSEYFVVNPMTRQWVALPPTSRRHQFIITGFVCDPAYVPEARKGGKLRYRVARISVDSWTEINIEIFSSEDGQWKEFAVPRVDRLPMWTSRAVVCNGILCWQLSMTGVEVMRLDPFKSEEKKIALIPDPPASFHEGLKKYKLGIYRGKLRMCQVSWSRQGYSEPSHVKIWELAKGEAGLKWRLVKGAWLQDIALSGDSSYAKLRKAALGFGYNSMWPLAFHPNEEDTIYFGCNRMNRIICYDLKRVSLEIVGECHFETAMGDPADAFPFQQPCWPTPVPALPEL